MKKVLQVILHLLGFPLLIGLAVLINLPIIKGGISYGIMVFVGIIVAVVMALIYYIAFIINVKSKKKSILKQTITLILVVFFCLCGLWVVVDFALPDFFSTATSGTVFYEDLTDNFQARADVQASLLEDFITRSYEAGTLPNEDEDNGYDLDTYLAQGYNNPNVKQLLALAFASIDTNGYASFVDPWIGMANDGRLTIPTLIHLLLDNRDELLETLEQPLDYDEKTREEIAKQNWDVLDMMGDSMDIALALDDKTASMVKLIVSVASDPLAGIISDKDILGSPIFVTYDGKAITLTPSNESRGVLGYMNMAWLNSNGLLYAVVTLISVRNLFLFFAGWLILSNFLIGLLRGMGKENGKLVHIKGVTGGKQQPQNPYQQNPYQRNPYQQPYPNPYQQPMGNYPPNPYRYSYINPGPNSYMGIDMAQVRRNLMLDSRRQRDEFDQQ